MDFTDWVIDIKMSGDGLMCFVPMCEGGGLVVGVNHFSARCTGNLVGVYHQDGYQAATEWVDQNPDWYERYCRAGKKEDVAE